MDRDQKATHDEQSTRVTTRLSCDVVTGSSRVSSPSICSPPALNTWSTMSAIEGSPPTDGAVLDELPEFELTYLYDDEEDPTEVTIFEGTSVEDLTTRWLTMDYHHTVALDSVR
jgi:hypothetical protein